MIFEGDVFISGDFRIKHSLNSFVQEAKACCARRFSEEILPNVVRARQERWIAMRSSKAETESCDRNEKCGGGRDRA